MKTLLIPSLLRLHFATVLYMIEGEGEERQKGGRRGRRGKEGAEGYEDPRSEEKKKTTKKKVLYFMCRATESSRVKERRAM